MERSAINWPDQVGGVLYGRLPPARPSWEPIIVTLLRRHVRRGAPPSLVRRLAGGEGHFHRLNLLWDLDGRAAQRLAQLLPASEKPIGIGVDLSPVERRIAIRQIHADYGVAGCEVPAPSRLARYFGCDRGTIDNDLAIISDGASA